MRFRSKSFGNALDKVVVGLLDEPMKRCTKTYHISLLEVQKVTKRLQMNSSNEFLLVMSDSTSNYRPTTSQL
jgi:hypothetical protein